MHDLREPLRTINVFSELLAELAKGRLGSEGDQILTEVFSGAERMRTLLEGLAGYSVALHETSGSSLPMGTSLQSAFKIVAAKLDAQIRASGATVTAANLPRVKISLERAMQLLENLIGNSLRFQSDAPPVIRITAALEEDGMWTIRVADNGKGIDPADCEAVFRPFMRVEGKKYPGAGLGLTICRRIVEAHGGTIRLESAPGQGSTCIFTLPEA